MATTHTMICPGTVGVPRKVLFYSVPLQPGDLLPEEAPQPALEPMPEEPKAN